MRKLRKREIFSKVFSVKIIIISLFGTLIGSFVGLTFCYELTKLNLNSVSAEIIELGNSSSGYYCDVEYNVECFWIDVPNEDRIFISAEFHNKYKVGDIIEYDPHRFIVIENSY